VGGPSDRSRSPQFSNGVQPARNFAVRITFSEQPRRHGTDDFRIQVPLDPLPEAFPAGVLNRAPGRTCLVPLECDACDAFGDTVVVDNHNPEAEDLLDGSRVPCAAAGPSRPVVSVNSHCELKAAGSQNEKFSMHRLDVRKDRTRGRLSAL